MIDSRVTGNFMSLEMVKRLNVLVQSINPYNLIVVDRTDYNTRKVTKGTILTKITIRQHTKEI